MPRGSRAMSTFCRAVQFDVALKLELKVYLHLQRDASVQRASRILINNRSYPRNDIMVPGTHKQCEGHR